MQLCGYFSTSLYFLTERENDSNAASIQAATLEVRIFSSHSFSINNLNPQDLGAGRKAQPLCVLPYCPRHTAQLNVCPDGLLSELFVNVSPAVVYLLRTDKFSHILL